MLRNLTTLVEPFPPPTLNRSRRRVGRIDPGIATERATTIYTRPATGLVISDANTADTITLSDGPQENGYQTTQVTTATNTIIFANKGLVTVDGGNKGDSVVLDNPDPAAALQ